MLAHSMAETALARLSDAVRALRSAKSIREVSRIRDMARAAGLYARAEELGVEAERYANEVQIRAGRRAGELLAAMVATGERAKGGEAGRRESPSVILEDLGVTPNQSSRWQRIAKVPERRFEKALADGLSESAIARLSTPKRKETAVEPATGSPDQSQVNPSVDLVADVLLSVASAMNRITDDVLAGLADADASDPLLEGIRSAANDLKDRLVEVVDASERG